MVHLSVLITLQENEPRALHNLALIRWEEAKAMLNNRSAYNASTFDTIVHRKKTSAFVMMRQAVSIAKSDPLYVRYEHALCVQDPK